MSNVMHDIVDGLNLIVQFNTSTCQFEIVREVANGQSRLTTNLELADVLMAIAEKCEDGEEYMVRLSRGLASLQKLIERRVAVLRQPKSPSMADEFLQGVSLSSPATQTSEKTGARVRKTVPDLVDETK